MYNHRLVIFMVNIDNRLAFSNLFILKAFSTGVEKKEEKLLREIIN